MSGEFCEPEPSTKVEQVVCPACGRLILTPTSPKFDNFESAQRWAVALQGKLAKNCRFAHTENHYGNERSNDVDQKCIDKRGAGVTEGQPKWRVLSTGMVVKRDPKKLMEGLVEAGMLEEARWASRELVTDCGRRCWTFPIMAPLEQAQVDEGDRQSRDTGQRGGQGLRRMGAGGGVVIRLQRLKCATWCALWHGTRKAEKPFAGNRRWCSSCKHLPIRWKVY